MNLTKRLGGIAAKVVAQKAKAITAEQDRQTAQQAMNVQAEKRRMAEQSAEGSLQETIRVVRAICLIKKGMASHVSSEEFKHYGSPDGAGLQMNLRTAFAYAGAHIENTSGKCFKWTATGRENGDDSVDLFVPRSGTSDLLTLAAQREKAVAFAEGWIKDHTAESWLARNYGTTECPDLNDVLHCVPRVWRSGFSNAYLCCEWSIMIGSVCLDRVRCLRDVAPGALTTVEKSQWTEKFDAEPEVGTDSDGYEAMEAWALAQSARVLDSWIVR